MSNSNIPACPSSTQDRKIKGRIKSRHARVASLLARGLSVSAVAKETGMTMSRIYHLLGDEDSFVNQEINRITDDLFASSDRFLINLYLKTLNILDELVDSPDYEIRHRAIEQVIRIYLERSKRSLHPSLLQNFYFKEQEDKNPLPQDIDSIIIEMRKSRGLEVDKIS